MKFSAILVITLLGAFTSVELVVAHPGLQGGASAETRAGGVAAEFLRTINARRFDRTCELLSTRFYRDNHVPSKARCVLALRIGFTWAPTYRFRILSVRLEDGRAFVRALANGAPGLIVLVEENDIFRVLSVRGA